MTPGFLWSSFINGKVPNEFRELTVIPELKIDLRYASTDNFTGINLYGEFKRAYLHELAFTKLEKAQGLLKKKYPDFNLLILDALRPRSVQRVLFSFVEGTSAEGYVANPDRGSVHNYGFAVDLTVVDGAGNELDMGTAFDDFTDLAQPRYEEKFLAEHKLSEQQLTHRKILREVMVGSGYRTIPNEWWHFNALPMDEIRKNFQIVE
jgi:D-alanyl-D-alanine dipeptidase